MTFTAGGLKHQLSCVYPPRLLLCTDLRCILICLNQRLAMDPRCKGMPLSSFLLKPMQRVTRYPLIIKNVRRAQRHFKLSVKGLHVTFTCFSLCCLLISDLREYSRVTSRPQPPESCFGKGRGAVFTGTNFNHNIYLVKNILNLCDALPFCVRAISESRLCTGDWNLIDLCV